MKKGNRKTKPAPVIVSLGCNANSKQKSVNLFYIQSKCSDFDLIVIYFSIRKLSLTVLLTGCLNWIDVLANKSIFYSWFHL